MDATSAPAKPQSLKGIKSLPPLSSTPGCMAATPVMGQVCGPETPCSHSASLPDLHLTRDTAAAQNCSQPCADGLSGCEDSERRSPSCHFTQSADGHDTDQASSAAQLQLDHEDEEYPAAMLVLPHLEALPSPSSAFPTPCTPPLFGDAPWSLPTSSGSQPLGSDFHRAQASPLDQQRHHQHRQASSSPFADLATACLAADLDPHTASTRGLRGLLLDSYEENPEEEEQQQALERSESLFQFQQPARIPARSGSLSCQVERSAQGLHHMLELPIDRLSISAASGADVAAAGAPSTGERRSGDGPSSRFGPAKSNGLGRVLAGMPWMPPRPGGNSFVGSSKASSSGSSRVPSSVSQSGSSNNLRRGAAAALSALSIASGSGKLSKPHFLKPKLLLQVDSGMSLGSWSSQGWTRHSSGTLSSNFTVPLGLAHISPDDLVKEKLLGRGQSGSVWLARWGGVEVALKELLDGGVQQQRTSDPSGCGAREALGTARRGPFEEAHLLSSLRHPCVVGLYGVVAEQGSCALVLEYMPSSSLRSALQSIGRSAASTSTSTSTSSPWTLKSTKAAIALEAARGMEFLHSQDVTHCDLKCDNLLADLRDPLRPVVKVGDLGLSRDSQGLKAGRIQGTLCFMAPELFQGGVGDSIQQQQQVTEKLDVYSFGIVLHEIWTLCCEEPYAGMSGSDIMVGVLTGTLRPEIPADMPPEWAALMEDCWSTDPASRPSFSEVVSRLAAMVLSWRAEEQAQA